MQLSKVPTTVLDVKDCKPKEALVRLQEQLGDSDAARAEWRKKARIAAVIGSCPKSLASLDSGKSVVLDAAHLAATLAHAGVAHWLKYIEAAQGSRRVETMAFPPQLEDVLGWSHGFRFGA